MKTSKLSTIFISHFKQLRIFGRTHKEKSLYAPTNNTRQNPKKADKIQLAYIGSIVPDEPAFQTPAFSRAGNMCQQNLLLALINAGLVPSIVLSFRPEQSFPRGSRLWVKKEQVSDSQGLNIELLPFINIIPVKQIMIGLGTLVALLFWGWRNRQFLHRIIYTFNISVPSGFFTLLAAFLTRSKVVAMVYDINVPGETVPFTLSWRLDYWLHKKLLPRFDGLVVITDSIINDFAPDMPFICVEGGINADLLCNSSIKDQKNDDALFVIAFAGGLKEANGILEILEAFSLLQGDQYRLRIAGIGFLMGKVKEAAAQDSRIEYCGYLSFDEVLTLYHEADVLINMRPTKSLNTKYFFPSKLMEYLASGTAVISTCTGNVEKDYADFVFLLKDETPQGLANMIEHVASVQQNIRADKGEKAKKYICTHKTWDAQGRRVVNFISKKIFHSDIS